MRVSAFITTISCVLLVFASSTLAKPWKDIVPLKTTRAEVVRLLGKPTGIDEKNRAVFSHVDGTVTISWKRPECLSKDFLWSEKDANDTALVYQITLEPKAFLKSIDEYEKPVPPPTENEDIKTVYKQWLEQDVNCLMGEGSSSCSIINALTGFGYSDATKLGVTAIYYFPSKVEEEAFRSKLQPCPTKTDVKQ